MMMIPPHLLVPKQGIFGMFSRKKKDDSASPMEKAKEEDNAAAIVPAGKEEDKTGAGN